MALERQAREPLMQEQNLQPADYKSVLTGARCRRAPASPTTTASKTSISTKPMVAACRGRHAMPALGRAFRWENDRPKLRRASLTSLCWVEMLDHCLKWLVRESLSRSATIGARVVSFFYAVAKAPRPARRVKSTYPNDPPCRLQIGAKPSKPTAAAAGTSATA